MALQEKLPSGKDLTFHKSKKKEKKSLNQNRILLGVSEVHGRIEHRFYSRKFIASVFATLQNEPPSPIPPCQYCIQLICEVSGMQKPLQNHIQEIAKAVEYHAPISLSSFH